MPRLHLHPQLKIFGCPRCLSVCLSLCLLTYYCLCVCPSAPGPEAPAGPQSGAVLQRLAAQRQPDWPQPPGLPGEAPPAPWSLPSLPAVTSDPAIPSPSRAPSRPAWSPAAPPATTAWWSASRGIAASSHRPGRTATDPYPSAQRCHFLLLTSCSLIS